MAVESEPITLKEMPTPAGLTEEIHFWESVFRDYKSYQCLVHDSEPPYYVFTVTELPHQMGPRMRGAMRKSKSVVKNALMQLSQNGKPHTALEKSIWQNLPETKRQPEYLTQAAQRLRCQRGVAEQFQRSLDLSRKYIKAVKAEIVKLGLPEDLAFLPHLESGYNNEAYSKVGARGIWQIMPKTAQGFLKVGRSTDERLHVAKATAFALNMLKENYERTNSWPLAVTAYNYGINGVMRAMKEHQTSDYMEIRRRHNTNKFRFAAKNFYPSFLAVRNLARASLASATAHSITAAGH